MTFSACERRCTVHPYFSLHFSLILRLIWRVNRVRIAKLLTLLMKCLVIIDPHQNCSYLRQRSIFAPPFSGEEKKKKKAVSFFPPSRDLESPFSRYSLLQQREGGHGNKSREMLEVNHSTQKKILISVLCRKIIQ
ncbi:uncharacterized protein LOC129320662 isoform X1 [Prosopis cineraria]|uniref:uncharacterized protein LOC129320662 isoform X1 n=1 Tax=Prosopis cineraria TaxID=364024 RepID=UPI00241055AE|nr:uncharacterized protein LOC129320662 isoform X1 [Prosopis cineraria]